jgi:hypothetical protein
LPNWIIRRNKKRKSIFISFLGLIKIYLSLVLKNKVDIFFIL